MALEKIIYTAHAMASGGRDGIVKSDDGKLDVKLNPPKEMGGNGNGTNPEQLFAAGYASCFIGALKFVAGTQKVVLPADTSINASVDFGTRTNGAKGFNVDVALSISVPGMDRAKAEALIHEAHEVCPYSNATRGNIDVTLILG
ncbi:organic hydroperoxide resistance protein [Methylotenera versatilis]|uniref:Peroxiredoxin, Ohr subfamily n=1 Tax=Methylotenera versatilis (strain 301) TaxID=666681 RepID=D7DJF1_METV0|nr:organic hydroperoxide resistance protein [Methylotenera versatilis]ADI30186.1 peroxiredoxin, Ohr subfamily [Methylotenera versatilis 301]